MNKFLSLFLLGLWPNIVFAGTQGETAELLAKSLYCHTFEVLSGDIGLILGLLIGFVGFMNLIFKQLHATGIILILAGVVITALPAFFESTLDGVTHMAAGSGIMERGNAFQSFQEGYRHVSAGGNGCAGIDNAILLEFIRDGVIIDDSIPPTTDEFGNPVDPWTGEPLGDGFSNTDNLTIGSHALPPSSACVNLRNNRTSNLAGGIVGGGATRLSSCHGTRSTGGACSGVCSSNHRGIDFTGAVGTPILAYADGRVVDSRVSTGGLGHTITIDHGNGLRTTYSHLNGRNVRVGDTVTAGSSIGGLGNSGNSTGPHLDFRVEVNGHHVDPCNHTNVCS